MEVTKVGCICYGNILEKIKAKVGWVAPSSFSISRSGSDRTPSLVLCSSRTPGGDPVLCTSLCAYRDRCCASDGHASDSRGEALLEVPPRPAASKPSSLI